ncbi:hypothetical protein [Tenacibaculum sp. SG-28]|uniref:hypothetical protein n=1 Tax=Tenacibaculum sp. SG-28 TaxID=754426 RepID=UPI000CF46EA4|nr:hypothetical protein [Tenacibaculum sp. SG-28]PQJ23191.1 hypothetical protein BSU00_02890 [Tenacibaculum sp. SG-28]
MSEDIKNIIENIDFDIYEPPKGHQNRFELRLKKKKQNSKSWIGIAASIVLLLGLTLNNIQEKNNGYNLSKVSPKMAETESFFMSTITQELKEVEKYRNLQTETIIEDSLSEIEELEDKFTGLSAELESHDNKRIIIQKMILNYQQRLDVLDNLLKALETKTEKIKPNKKNENYL